MGTYSGRGCEFLLLAKFSKLFTKAKARFAPQYPEAPGKGCFRTLYLSVLGQNLHSLDFIYPFNKI